MESESYRIKHDAAPKGVARVISVTSGKGGVGKTHTVINLAIALANQNRRVLLLDADLGLANADVLLGIPVHMTLHDVLTGEARLKDVIVSGPFGIDLIPAASGIESICSLRSDQRIFLAQEIEELAADYDYLLIDTQAGIGPDVMYFNSASNEIVCVVNPEPTSLTDAFALIKVLSRNYGEKTISILLNNVSGKEEAQRVFQRLAHAVERYLHVELVSLGFIPADPAVRAAIHERRALLQVFPSSPAALAISRLAARIDQDFYLRRVKGGMQFFFKQLLEMGANGN